jgi:hypothetical protein
MNWSKWNIRAKGKAIQILTHHRQSMPEFLGADSLISLNTSKGPSSLDSIDDSLQTARGMNRSSIYLFYHIYDFFACLLTNIVMKDTRYKCLLYKT